MSTWSPQQDSALKSVDDWLKNSEQQVFRLFGYAGTGKTTLARHFAQDVSGQVLFGAFTGKAAHVLRSKGCDGATTIHSLIYHTKEKGKARLKELEVQLMTLKQELAAQGLQAAAIDGHKRVKDIRELLEAERKNVSRPSFTLNSDSEVRRAKLVIIDECSMIDDRMGEDLLSFGTKILVLGDPAQLPPVMGQGFFTEGVKPDVMLEEIHRQAEGNPIIQMATEVRKGNRLSIGQYGESKVIDLDDMDKTEVLRVDQLIAGKNATRFAHNKRMRQLQGRQTPYPEAGDKLVCLRNNHELGLLNGAIWEATDVGSTDPHRTVMTVKPQGGGDEITVEAHSFHFLTDPSQKTNFPWHERQEAEEFDFGYSLTCHKAQGSQWNNVMVFDESFVFRENKDKWLYTAITRAAEKITIVRM